MNPFKLGPYTSPDNFCDRIEETKDIIQSLESGRHVTLFSPRRMGKTGLISHVQHTMCRKNKKTIAVLFDAFNTDSDESFSSKFVSAVLTSIQQKEDGITKRLTAIFGKYGFGIKLNPFTGSTEIEININDKEAARTSMQSLLSLIKTRKYRFIIGVDEFQQIATYTSTLIDATLREFLQSLTNVHFIFSGSQRHMLYGLFSDTKKPLYRITDYVNLGKISYPAYTAFIRKQFEREGKTIHDTHIHNILTWTSNYTYYTQYFCSRLFDTVVKETTDRDLLNTKQHIIRQQEPSFFTIKNLLSKHQWQLLRAISLERGISQPTASSFKLKHNLSGSSTVLNSLKVLIDKELIYEELHKDKSVFIVYDVFLEKWINQTYT